MKKHIRKPAALWLKLTVLGALLVGLCSAYEIVSTGGHCFLPSISLTADRSYTLSIKGANGLRFCGIVSVKMADGRVARHNVDGVVPETFEIMGESVSVRFRKCEENGSLGVAISNGNGPAAEGITTARYGTVSVGVN